MNLTTPQAVELLTAALTVNGRSPQIQERKIAELVHAHALRNASETKWIRVDSDELHRFAQRTRYIPDAADLLNVSPLIYRVSVLARRPTTKRSPVFGDNGQVLREYSGVDFDADPASPAELGGWEGVWPISAEKTQRLIADNGTMLAACRGYVAPGHWRTVVSATDVGVRRYLHTKPAPSAVRKFLGTGIWIDIPDGAISAFI